MDDEITTADAAAILGVKPRQVRVYFEEGLLPGRKLTPRVLLFKRADVEAFKKPVHPWNRWGDAKKKKKPRKPKGVS